MAKVSAIVALARTVAFQIGASDHPKTDPSTIANTPTPKPARTSQPSKSRSVGRGRIGRGNSIDCPPSIGYPNFLRRF